MDKKLHVKDHRVDWSDHSDAVIVGPLLESKVARIRDAVLDMNSGKLSMFSCLQVIAMEVFTQSEIEEQSVLEQSRVDDEPAYVCHQCNMPVTTHSEWCPYYTAAANQQAIAKKSEG